MPHIKHIVLLFSLLLLLTGCASDLAITVVTTPTPHVQAVSITEFTLPTTASGPEGIVQGIDGNLWFTETVGKIGRITPEGEVTEFAIPTAQSYPRGITAGPNGTLWFTDFGYNKIGRITPQGAIVEFGIPTAQSHPIGIARATDGTLWFTESLSNKIGRITLGKS